MQNDNAQYAHLRSQRSRAALRGAVWSALNGFIPAAVGAGVFTISSRLLEPVEFGLVAFAAGITSLAGSIAPAGFGDALVQRENISDCHLSTVFWICLGAGFIILGMITALAYPIADYSNQPLLRTLLPVMGLKSVFDMATVVPMALLARSMSFNLVAMRTLATSIVAGAVCLGLLALGYGLWALALSQVAAAAASCIGSLVAAGWRPRRGIRLSAFKDLRRYGLFASGTRLVQLIYPDQVLIGALIGPTALGLFGFSRRIFQLLNDVIAGAMSSVAHVLLASLQTEKEKLRGAFQLSSFVSAAVSFPMFGGLMAIANDVVPVVFGPQWVPATALVQGFCMIGLISSIGFIQAALINSQGHADWWFWYQCSKQVIHLLAILLSYRYGVTGIVVSMAVASFLIWPVTVVKSSRLLDMQTRDYLSAFYSPTLACLVMMAGVWWVREISPTMLPPLRLAVCVATGALLYSVVLILTSKRRLSEIYTMLKKNKGR